MDEDDPTVRSRLSDLVVAACVTVPVVGAVYWAIGRGGVEAMFHSSRATDPALFALFALSAVVFFPSLIVVILLRGRSPW